MTSRDHSSRKPKNPPSKSIHNPWPELQSWAEANQLAVIGVDEAGRGPLFGPVVAGAVLLSEPNPIEGLACSKLLSEKKRNALCPEIKAHSIAWAVAQSSVEEIDALNILQASLLAMTRAVDGVISQAGLQPRQCLILVDGNKIPVWPYQARAVVKGDVFVPAISAGSILAKVWRDQWCETQAIRYPVYGLDAHKGYPTTEHIERINQHGPSPLHRKSFRPVREALAKQQGKLF